MAKRVSYVDLLKEALNEYDASGLEKGPMVGKILAYKGDGELETHKDAKDAGSILERYYFMEDEDKQVEVDDKKEPDGDECDEEELKEQEMEDPGNEEAGGQEIDDPGEDIVDVKEAFRIFREQTEDSKDDKEDDEDGDELNEQEMHDPENEEAGGQDLPSIDDLEDDIVGDDVEKSVIERLIQEMEDEEDPEDSKEGEEDELDVDEKLGESKIPASPSQMGEYDEGELEQCKEALRLFMEDDDKKDDDFEKYFAGAADDARVTIPKEVVPSSEISPAN